MQNLWQDDFIFLRVITSSLSVKIALNQESLQIPMTQAQGYRLGYYNLL